MKERRSGLFFTVGFMAVLAVLHLSAAQVLSETPKGQMKVAVHFLPSIEWVDPTTTTTLAPALTVFYLFHDSLLKPMPGNLYAPCLAESWNISQNHKVYEFRLRKGVRFHNGDEMTAEDVVYTFRRYKGLSNQIFHSRVDKIEAVDPHLVRVTFNRSFPDFLDYFLPGLGTIGWIVPKKYMEKVGEAGYKRHPVGCGPYKFIEFTPLRFVGEAFEGFWRKVPKVKRLEFYGVPEISTRYAMVKRGEVDFNLSMIDVFYERVKNDPTLTLAPVISPNTFIIYMASQWDPKSPWFDQRVRKAAALAIDRKMVSDVQFPGGGIVDSIGLPGDPETVRLPPIPYDPEQAKKLLMEAGYPKGVNAGTFYPQNENQKPMGQLIINYWKAVGINVETVYLERGVWYANRWGGKMKGATFYDPIGPPTIASRVSYLFSPQASYGNYPDIHALWDQFNQSVDPNVRKDLITRIQWLIHDKTMFIPLIRAAVPSAIGPKVKGNPFKIQDPYPLWTPAPMEDYELKD